MVNGKPPLIYGGGGSPASTTAAKSRDGRYNRIGDSFSSLLPQAQAAQAAPAAVQAARAVHTPAANLDGQSNARFHPGNFPESYLSAGSRTFASHGASLPLPPGAQSRAQARAQAAPQAGNANWQTQVQQAQRLPASNGPRISGLPITGRSGIGMADTRVPVGTHQGFGMADTRQSADWRRNIGMEDTRVNAGTRDIVAGRAGMKPPAQTANTARLHSAHTAYVAERPQTDAFSSYANRYGRDVSGQSFLSYGFAGKNAELALKKLGYDVHEARNVRTTATLLQSDPYALNNKEYIPPDKQARTRQAEKKAARAASAASGAAESAKNTAALPEKAYPNRSLVGNFYSSASQGLGALAAKFESGEEGIAAIGYDRKGGTSYGKYQIASRPGTMANFIRYLDDKAPDIGKRLAAAGPANTGGRSGKMPAEWRTIAAEDPERFERLQSDFIRTSHFEPAMQAISVATGVNFEQLPAALQEVLFSTAVQHGPAGATRIFSQALRRVDADKLTGQNGMNAANKKAGQQLITHIYNLRAGQFASSTSRVQSAVRNRLQQEMREAMHMLA